MSRALRRAGTSRRACARFGRASTRESAAGRGRGSSSRGRPPRCGGYIQSEKWSTSKPPSQRSAGGHLHARPRRAPRVRERQHGQPSLDVDARRARPRPVAFRALRPARTQRRRPRPRRARAASRARSCRRPPADGQGRDVVGDTYASIRACLTSLRSGRYSKLRKWIPRRRVSSGPGTFVGVIVKRAAQPRSGTVIGVVTPGPHAPDDAVRAHRLRMREEVRVAEQA